MPFRLKRIFVFLAAQHVGSVCMAAYMITWQNVRYTLHFDKVAFLTNGAKIYSKRKFPILQYTRLQCVIINVVDVVNHVMHTVLIGFEQCCRILVNLLYMVYCNIDYMSGVNTYFGVNAPPPPTLEKSSCTGASVLM